MANHPQTRAKVVEIKGKSPNEGEPNEQTVILELEGLGRIKCFDGVNLSSDPISVSMRDKDVGKNLNLIISLLNHEPPKETEKDDGFYATDRSSNKWNYRVVGEIEEIEHAGKDSNIEEKIILNIKGHFVQITSSSEFDDIEEGKKVVFPNNIVDVKSVEREKE